MTHPSNLQWSPDGTLLGFLHAGKDGTRQLYTLEGDDDVKLVVDPGDGGDTEANLSLEEKLRRERQRLMAVGVTSYAWGTAETLPGAQRSVVFPMRGSLLGCAADASSHEEGSVPTSIIAKEATGASGSVLDARLSPDGRFVAFVQEGELYACGVGTGRPYQLTVGARGDDQTNGLADFIAQEEMDRYVGFWWSADSKFIAFQRTDDRRIPAFKIVHQGTEEVVVEEHRYPFAGAENPAVSLGVVALPSALLQESRDVGESGAVHDVAAHTPLADDVLWLDLNSVDDDAVAGMSASALAAAAARGEAAPFAYEYLARVHWLADGSLAAELQSRDQMTLRIARFDARGAMQRRALGGSDGARRCCRGAVLLTERRDACWVNLHNMFELVGSRHVLWASERSGFSHLYLYALPSLEATGAAAAAALVSVVTAGDYVVDSIVGVAIDGDDVSDAVVFFHANAEAPLEKHLFVAPLVSGVFPSESAADEAAAARVPPALPLCRLTGAASGQHNVVLDRSCTAFADSYSSARTPPRIEVWALPRVGGAALREEFARALGSGVIAPAPRSAPTLRCTLFQSAAETSGVTPSSASTVEGAPSAPQLQGKSRPLIGLHSDAPSCAPTLESRGVDNAVVIAPEFIPVTSRDGSTVLWGALYRPNVERFGPGPYAAIVSTYGGPHVQFVCDAWGRASADARAQRFRDMGFVVWKLDNRGSARRGLAFESAVRRDMARVEVSDQEDGVQWLIDNGLCDGRVGVYGWSYGGYMSLSLLCRSSMFTAAVAGAPVTHWDGYDTHYTERYMGTPQNNTAGYESSSVMAHVANMAPAIVRPGGGKMSRLLLVSGLIDENVHWRHTGRLINALVAARKRFDVLPFPDERHSPRRPADRRYMEQRITDFFVETLELRGKTKI